MVRDADSGGGSIWNSEFSLDGALDATLADGPDDPAIQFMTGLPDTFAALGDIMGTAGNLAEQTVTGPGKLVSAIDGVGSIVLWIIEQAINRNPIDYIARPFTGDWDALYRAADVWLRIAASAAATDERVSMLVSATFTGDAHWTGVAATRSSIWLSDMARSMGGLAESAAAVSVSLASVAKAADELAQAAGKIIETLIDTLLTALAASFILPGAGQAAVAAGSTGLILLRIDQVLDLLQSLVAAVQTLQGLYYAMQVKPLDV